NGSSKDGIHNIDGINSGGLHGGGPAGPASGRRRFEKRRKERRGMAYVRPDSGRNAIQPAQANQYEQCGPAGIGVVAHYRTRRRAKSSGKPESLFPRTSKRSPWPRELQKER